jgi:hypothetical protein
MFRQVKGVVVGFVMGAIVVSSLGAVFAAPIEKKITALYDGIKIYIDGVLVTPKDANGNVVEPFIYEGTTYLPVRAVGEAFGKTVDWDGISKSVYVGKRTDAEQYLGTDMQAYQSSDKRYYIEYTLSKGESFSMNGVKYYRGITLACYRNVWALYNLNGQYSTISGMLGHIDGTDMINKTLLFYADDKVVKEIELNAFEMAQPFSLNVSGVMQLTIEIKAKDTDYWATYGLGDVVLK